MQDEPTIWNAIFAREGVVFVEPHEDMPRLADQLEERHTRTLLDLGCGTGRHVLFFAERGFEVYGLDGAPVALETTRRRLDEAGLKAQLVEGTIFEPLPFEDAFFDALISIQVIHHARVAQISKLVAELARVLKPGGLLFVTVPQLWHEDTQYKEIEPRTFVPLTGWEAGLPHHYFTREELVELFKDFDVLDIHFDRRNYYCVTVAKR